MTKHMIDQLVQTARQAEEAEKAARAHERQEFVSRAEQAMAEALGELWDVLFPCVQHTVREGQRLKCRVEGAGLADLELAPFWIHYAGLNGRTPVYLSPFEFPSGGVATPDALAAFLGERRAQFHQTRQEERDKRITTLSYGLQHYNAHKITGLDQAEQALQELLALDPERADAWRYQHAGWQDAHQAEQARQAEARRLDGLEAEYRAACADWLRRCQYVATANREALDKLQADLDHTSQVWRLTYGICAMGEDDYLYADTESVYTTTLKPDADGWWLCYDGNGLARRHYFHPVSVEGPIVLQPTHNQGGIGGRLNIWDQSNQNILETLYFNPGRVTLAEVQDMVNLVVQPYPDEPDAPDDLGEFRAGRAMANARGDVYHEEPY